MVHGCASDRIDEHYYDELSNTILFEVSQQVAQALLDPSGSARCIGCCLIDSRRLFPGNSCGVG